MTCDGSRKNAEREDFNTSAAPDEPSKQPSGKELNAAGITTESSLDFRKTQHPNAPAPHPTPDDPEGWEAARQKALEDHERQVEKQREDFRERIKRARARFNERSLD